MTDLLTPRDWQHIVQQKAIDLFGSPEGLEKQAEAKRYGMLADEIERLRAKVAELEAKVPKWLPLPDAPEADMNSPVYRHLADTLEHLVDHVTCVHQQIAEKALAAFPNSLDNSAIKDSLTIESRAEIAWEATGDGLTKYVTDERYKRFSPAIQKYYKPFRCSQCIESSSEIEARCLEELAESWGNSEDAAVMRKLAAEKRAGNSAR